MEVRRRIPKQRKIIFKKMREVTELVTVLSSRVKLRISDLERDAEQRTARGNNLPGGDKEGGNVKQML